MEKKTKKLLLIGGVLVAAGAAAWFLLMPQNPWTLPANAAKAAAIQAWYSSTGNPGQWASYMQSKASQNDIDVMYALITQYWDTQTAPPAQLANYFSALGTAVQSV